jgi:hypothetical protein
MRSRYEVANNPFLFGVVQQQRRRPDRHRPHAPGPHGDAAYNRAVEASWREWCAEVGLVEKLKTAKLAKSVDGEGFLVLKTVEDLEHPSSSTRATSRPTRSPRPRRSPSPSCGWTA